MTIEKSQLFEKEHKLEHHEIERKFIATDSTLFDHYRASAHAITQLYLSHSDDEYSLRVRKATAPTGEMSYIATLKDRGIVTPAGLARMEIETPISEAIFQHYAEQGHPTLYKERAELGEGITADWVEGSNTPIIEVENPHLNESASQFLSVFSDVLIERTGQSDVDNESLAHAIRDSHEQQRRSPQVTPEQIIEDILAYRSIGTQKIVIGIGGRSGSGKSTLAHELQNMLLNHPDIREYAALVSTDDYHRGKQYLEDTYGAPWINWEDVRVYDTAHLARDIAAWSSGESINKRHFDFTTEEPVLDEPLGQSDILIVEGIHAGSPDLASVRQIYYEVPTPLAVSLGRDVRRLLATNRSQAAMKSPEERLRYMIEIGEPTYSTIEQAPRNSFAGCARRLGATAIHTPPSNDRVSQAEILS